MRYIRTKDGRIVELPKATTLMKYDNTIIDLNAIKKGKVGHEIISALIDNQADTIEELCDEFVIHYAYGYHLITISDGEIAFKDDFDYGFKLKFALENDYEIYGAIWTDKGLIYVAKMNDKGELELL